MLRARAGCGMDRGPKLTMQAIHRQLAAMPCPLYLVRLIHHGTRRVWPGDRIWTAAQLLDPAAIGFLRIRNREGYDVYVQPYAADRNAGYTLLDLDAADANILRRLRADGCHPCAVLQTSPGHLQAWIHVSLSPLEPRLATAVARQLARHYGGDPASADWRHLGRLAGFTNQKTVRRMWSGYAPWVTIVQARTGVAPNADSLLRSAREAVELPPGVGLEPPLRSGCARESEAGAIYQRCVAHWRIAQRFPRTDWSIVDLWVARHLLRLGLPAAQVETVIRLGSPQFPRRHGDPEDYLRRTLNRAAAAAFPPTGGPV